MEAPDDTVIADIKKKHPGRILRFIEMVHDEETHCFLMTGPNREEYKKYTTELGAADKDIDKMSTAVERAALAQIRWPEREQVKALFDQKPGIVINFAGELAAAAGTNVEVRAKNL